MHTIFQNGQPTIGILAGWQYYRTATNLSYLAPVFRGVSRAAQDLKCNLLLGCGIGPSALPSDPLRPAWSDPSPDVDFIPIGPWNTDGILIANPLHTGARSKYVQGLIANKHPILFIGSGEKGPTIVADNSIGIQGAMQHLVDHGHDQIAFIAGSIEDMGGDSGDRLSAFQEFLELNGLDIDKRRIEYGRHVYDGGYSAMKKILNSNVSFTAVLASNDEAALGAIKALEESGREIPQDVAVIGFDNRLEGAVHEPGLSSVHVPLFNMGYQALKSMYEHLVEKTELSELTKVHTHLVTRKSCGCNSVDSHLAQIQSYTKSELINNIRMVILSQAHGLTEDEVELFCKQLVDSYINSIEQTDPKKFQNTLINILQGTSIADDDAHIWLDVISVLGNSLVFRSRSKDVVKDILENARLAVSVQAQKQYQQYVLKERNVSSRLSLLTDRLLVALDETQIQDVLANQLAELNIRSASVAMFESEDNDQVAWSVLRDLNNVDQPLTRFPSKEFPPNDLLSNNHPFILTLIPLVSRTGQLGYVVFGSEPLDLYGTIVQQLGGAFNTARLYRQAVMGRQLAEEASRMKTRFLSTISHELRTPLSLIVGLSDILLQENEDGSSPLPASVQKDVERIHAYSQHLGGLIGDVLDLASSDAGQLRLNKDYLELGEVLRVVSESGRQLASDKGLSWQVAIPRNGPWVLGDRTRLQQVALNLVNNAIKYTANGEVGLKVESDDKAVTISVYDTGLGIPPEEQETIFNEFDRSQRSVHLGYSGLGLGLAICKRLIEMHGGTIGVRSAGEEGSGSTFYFTLPVVRPPAEHSTLKITPSKEQRVIVVVTDQPELSDDLRKQLREHGFEVHVIEMGSGSPWLSSLFEMEPDAVLLDTGLASEHDWEAIRAIKENPSVGNTPVLFYRSDLEGRAFLEFEYLTKPLELDALTRILDQQWLSSSDERLASTILVVDDEPIILEIHARIVRSHSSSNRVLKANNGRNALNILEHEIVDLVLLDLQMPEMDGFEVLEHMRDNESMRKIPVIIVTGSMLTNVEMSRLNQGVVAVLQKGLFSLDETVEHINTALERKHRISGDAQRLVRKAMAYIHEHYAETLTRKDIAQHVSISEDHLTVCFRQELGTTPIKYLQRYRINQAKPLLLDNEKSITEIAYLVGFSDSGYFSRVFHREIGVSPEKFRRT